MKVALSREYKPRYTAVKTPSRSMFITWPVNSIDGTLRSAPARSTSASTVRTGTPRICACTLTQSVGVERTDVASPEIAPASSAPAAVSGSRLRASSKATNISVLPSTFSRSGGPNPRKNARGPSILSISSAHFIVDCPGLEFWSRTFIQSRGCPRKVAVHPAVTEATISRGRPSSDMATTPLHRRALAKGPTAVGEAGTPNRHVTRGL